MVEVTQADMVAAEAQAKKHYQTAYDYEMDLREAFATHRQQAAKAERDRLLAEIADYLEGFAGGHYVVQSCASVVRNWQAAALESQP